MTNPELRPVTSSDPPSLTYDVDVLTERHSFIRRRVRKRDIVLSLGASGLSLALYARIAPWTARQFEISLSWSVQVPLILLICSASAIITYALLRAYARPPDRPL